MGQQASSRKNGECVCGCGAWERKARSDESTRREADPTRAAGSPEIELDDLPQVTSVHRYVSAVTERWGGRECVCRRRRWRPRPACVCTSYKPVAETTQDTTNNNAQSTNASNNYCRDERFAAVLALGARDLRRELDALAGLHNETSTEPSADRTYLSTPGELYVLSVTPHPRNDVAYSDPEDEDERARARRALEIAQGVEAPPGYRPHHIQVVTHHGEIALLLRAPSAAAPLTRVHTQVDYIHCLVPDLKAITACCFYWGKMDRYEAERLLDNKPEGTFLLRDSAQEEHLFSVSFRKYGRSLHARIEHYNHKFSFDSHDPAVFSASTVTGLIEHYKDPACVMFFEPMLTAPLPRTEPFSLQQLARATIVSSTSYDGVDELPLPSRLRAYLKEYHYRQRVCVRRLEPEMLNA